ncbi:MAG: sulfatase, partial [Proteobacteria bacterium]|nr:sulfatase [Pseudomonadota bacterium]
STGNLRFESASVALRPRISRLYWFGLLLLATNVGFLSSCRCSSPRPDPNVVLIVIDTLRQDRLGVYGHNRDTSPQLDKLGAKSVVYERAYSQAPWTTPSIGSILTSRYPSQLGIDKGRTGLSRKERLVSELLANKNYRTGGVISHSYCGKRWDFHQGFEVFDESNVLGHDAVTSAGVTDRAIEFVDTIATTEPYFLFAHYFDPHFAYLEHEGHSFGDGAGYKGPITSDMKVHALRKISRRLSPDDVEELLRIYDSEVAITDAQIGRLIEHLHRRGDLNNTLVVVTADHGEEFLDHQRWGHTTHVYEELIRVPLIVHYPDQQRGRVSTPVALIDILPTILATVGMDTPRKVEGRNLRGDLSAERVLFSETNKGAQLSVAIRGCHKLIVDHEGKPAELYDLSKDNDETNNIALQYPKLVAELSRKIRRWSKKNSETKKSGTKVNLSDEEVQQLEALGYVDP